MTINNNNLLLLSIINRMLAMKPIMIWFLPTGILITIIKYYNNKNKT